MPAAGSLGGAGDIQRPPGVGAQMAIGEFWPSISESDIQSVADEQRAAETRFSTYGDQWAGTPNHRNAHGRFRRG